MNSIPKQNTQLFWLFACITFASVAAAMLLNQVLLLAIPFAILFALLCIANTKLIYYALLFALPISINLKEFGLISLDFPDEPLMLAITTLFPFVFLLNRNTNMQSSFFRHPIIGWMIVWILWVLTCTITSTYPALSIKYFLSKLWYVIPFIGMTTLVVYQDIQSIKKIFLLYAIPLLAMVLFVTYRHSKLGFSFEDVTAACSPYFVNHVCYGSLVSLFVPLSVGAIFYFKRFTANWFYAIGATLIFLMAVYLAYSRGAWAAVFFAGGIFVAVRFKLVKIFFITFYLFIAAAAIFLSTNNKYIDFAPRPETGIMHDNLVDHLIATLKGKDISSNERFYRWVAGARMGSVKPIFGFGPNTFYENYKPYTVHRFHTYVSRNNERSTMHNYFLFMLAEQGYVGMLIYAVFIFLVFAKGQKLYHQLTDKKLKIILISVLCMLGAFFINNTLSELIENDKLGSCFFIGIGIIVALDMRHKNGISNQLSATPISISEPLV